jgi:hypothetical protein
MQRPEDLLQHTSIETTMPLNNSAEPFIQCSSVQEHHHWERLSLRAFRQGFVRRAPSLQLRFLHYTHLALSTTASPEGQISSLSQVLRAGPCESLPMIH